MFDLRTFDWLFVSCACDVRSDVEARWDSQVVELVVMQKKIPFEKFWITMVGLFCAITTPFQCHLRTISDVRYLKARCGYRTFELAV